MTKITMPAERLAEVLAVTIPFTGTDKTLPSIRGVRIIPSAESVVFASTDRFVLAEQTVPVSDVITVDSDVAATVPLDTAKAWLKMAKAAAHNLPAEIVLDDDTVTLTIWGETVTARQESDQWVPNHERLFPANPGESETFGRIHFSSDVIGKFTKAFPKRQTLAFAFGTGDRKPVTVTVPGTPGFRALIMPARQV